LTGASGTGDAAIRRRSGWLIPLAVFVVTAVLSGLILLYYLGPAPRSFIEEHPSVTGRRDAVDLSVGGISFKIPSNYIRLRTARKGGPLAQVALFAALPHFRGYSDTDAETFSDNAADSAVVDILLHEEQMKLGELDRFKRIYLDYVVSTTGKAGPFGLTQYEFRDDSGYRGKDLYLATLGKHTVVLRCDRLSTNDQSPSCIRDTRLAGHASLSYRFKRSQLSRWREIAAGVDKLMHSFMQPR
jgi:hypothetical protein